VAYGSGNNRVTHADYNKEVRKQLEAYIQANGFSRNNRMSQEQTQTFIENMMNGRDFEGKKNKTLRTFNEGVMADAKAAGHRGPFTMDAATARRQGIAYARTNNRAQIILGRLAAGAFVIGLFDQGAKFASALDNVATNGNFVKAIDAIDKGNLPAATTAIFGDATGDFLNNPSVAHDIYDPFKGTLSGSGVQLVLDEAFKAWVRRIADRAAIDDLLERAK